MDFIKKNIKYLVPIILFAIISLLYFPDLIKGKQLLQNDISHHKGMSKEATDFNKKSGEQTLWTNSMFGGMPMYLIGLNNHSNLMKYVDKGLKTIPRPAGYIFIAFIAFYILLLSFKIDYKLAFIGALAYGFSSYFFIILEAGHNSKMVALAYLPGVMAGIILVLNRNKQLIGAAVFAVFLALELLANHLQITYYGVLMILIYGAIELYNAIKNKTIKDFSKGLAVLIIAAIFAVGSNFASLYTTYEYGKQSLRGPSELNINENNQTSGLDKDYATSWSYGKVETFNLFIPNLFGGASGSELSKKSAIYNKLIEVGASKKQAKESIKRMPTYWGPQPFTSGPVYIGALIMFLFVMGIFLVKGSMRTWLLLATALSVMLAWGHNFMFLTDLFFDYFPGYNKFRTVSMILVIAEFTIPLLGILALKNIVEQKVTTKQILTALKYSTGILGGIALLFLINPGILNFTSESDAQLPEYLQDAILDDRASMMRSDVLRSIVFILIGAVTIWLFIKQKIKVNYLYIILAVAILTDLWSVNKRYLNSDDFESKRKVSVPFTASNADNSILQDKSNYRVLNISVSTFNDASTSYFHKSIGGYHGAKMRRYQELADFETVKEMQSIMSTLQNKPTQLSIDNNFSKTSVLNMLNTKYVIYNPEAPPLVNHANLGSAWFVNSVKIVENANAEIKEVQNFNPATIAIVDKRFEKELFDFTKDNTAKIELTEYKPNHLTYKTTTKTEQLAVLSEIYYDKGWEAYIDGKPTSHFRVNYILRAMKIPAGNHTIEYKFEPKSWALGSTVSLISSIIIILGLFAALYFELFRKEKESVE